MCVCVFIGISDISKYSALNIVISHTFFNIVSDYLIVIQMQRYNIFLKFKEKMKKNEKNAKTAMLA